MQARIRFVGLAVFLGLALGGLGGCQTAKDTWNDVFYAGEVLDYEQYLSIDQDASPPPTADEVLERLGPPMSVHDRDGARRRIDYHAYSLTGERMVAEFHFDKNERLVKKMLW